MRALVSDGYWIAELQGVFRDAMGIDPVTPIDRETRFFADLGLASIDAVVLGESLQRHFDQPIPFPDLMAELGRRAQRDLTIGELIDFLRVHVDQPGFQHPQD